MATKPILLAVDDDTAVLEAVMQDMRRHYGANFRILRAASGQAALDTCKQLKERGDAVALILSDQRMPGMTGVDLLERSIQVYPDAKRVLLTAYADTEAAIKAINAAKIHYYLNKPWDPPEEKLYPVLDDLLEAWGEGYKPPFDGLRIVGVRWAQRDHLMRDFLSRNHVPYVWLDPADTPDAIAELEKYQLNDSKLPVVMFPTGEPLIQPSQTELASRIGQFWPSKTGGLSVQAAREFYDLIVLGGGPAGLGAAVYGASEGLRTLVVEPEAPGGQAGSSSKIENYLGFPAGVSGADLARRAFVQATRFGAEFVTQRGTALRSENKYHFVKLADDREVSCYSVLIALGVDYTKLEIPGIEKFTGAGVYYGAAMTEAMSCTAEEVFIVGGANSAGQAAMYFANYASKVTMLIRASSLEKGMSKYLVDQICQRPNIVVETNTEVIGVDGEERLSCIRLRGPGGERMQSATSMFIFIGAAPKTEWLPSELARDSRGFLLTGPQLKAHDALGNWHEDRQPFLLECNVPGIFAAGDVRSDSVKRVASAVGQGSMAVQFIHQYLAKL
ncbi:MAG TPA: FAD-dependent oxidoreductase [Acidobacteriaceae bacterium]|nr:FAD-dependent oxidoreductase [Acidobacteriaceae bacterium]